MGFRNSKNTEVSRIGKSQDQARIHDSCWFLSLFRNKCLCQWGHQGIGRKLAILRTHYFWPGLGKKVASHIKQYFSCTVTKAPTPKAHTPQRHLLAFCPFETVAIDFRFSKTRRWQRWIWRCANNHRHFYKYSQAVPCKNQTTPVAAKALLEKWFSHYYESLRNCILIRAGILKADLSYAWSYANCMGLTTQEQPLAIHKGMAWWNASTGLFVE